MSKKSRTSAFLLSFFLGIFGAHRFYVGKGGSAVAMLLLSISFIGLIISGVWNLVDWITILSGNFKDKDGLVVSEW